MKRPAFPIRASVLVLFCFVLGSGVASAQSPEEDLNCQAGNTSSDCAGTHLLADRYPPQPAFVRLSGGKEADRSRHRSARRDVDGRLTSLPSACASRGPDSPSGRK